MRTNWHAGLLIMVLCMGAAAPARAATVCTIVAEAKTGRIVHETGDCATRVTPASTFKVALAVMGFDAGFLKGPHDPVLPFKPGYVSWRENWKQSIDPTTWLEYSVVWYSQQIAHALGEPTLHRYAARFDYGNADFSGDPGKNNGLDRAWIASSLEISPREEVAFLSKLASGRLPVSDRAMGQVREIVEVRAAGDDWTVHGKTGGAPSRDGTGQIIKGRPWGWYVGWAEKGDQTYAFARLIRDDRKQAGPVGFRARDGLIADWPGMAGGF